MEFRTATVIAFSLATMAHGVAAHAGSCERTAAKAASQSLMQLAQFDNDDDGVAGCVNQCKLDLEICLGLRPPGESSDRCDQLEDQCENGCYNTGPDAGKDND